MNTLTITNEATRQAAAEFISNLSLEKEWEVTVARYVKRRSTRQNALYWAWITEVAGHVSDYTGYDKEEVHEFFKQNFLPGRHLEIEGMDAVHRTTKKLNTTEMAEYTDKIYRWASTELGLVLPLPPIQTEQR